MSGNGGRACELSVGVHTSHGVGHSVAGGSCRHVIGMESTSGTAAGCNGEVLEAVLNAPLLVGACNGMLEACRVGGVSGDGYADLLKLHDRNALGNVIGAVAADSRTGTVGVSGLADDLDFLGVGIELGLYIGEAVDSRNNEGCVLSETVKDNAERLSCGPCLR